MGRGLAGRPWPCALHPHHAAVDRCDECTKRSCKECFVQDGERLLCQACHAAAPLRAWALKPVGMGILQCN